MEPQITEVQKAAGVGIRRWIVSGVVFIAVLTAFFDRINVAVLFTNAAFKKVMGVGNNAAAMGMLMTAFLLAYGVSSLVLSFIGDSKMGPRKSLGLLTVIWSVMMAIMGAASSYVVVLLSRIVLGVSEGPQFSLGAKLVNRWFPKHEQGRANALWAIGSPIGSAIGIPMIIFVVASFGWRASFYTLSGISLIIVLPLVLVLVRDDPSHAKGITAPELNYIESGRVSTATQTIGHSQAFKEFVKDYRFWMTTLLFAAYLSLLWGVNAWLPTYFEKVEHFKLSSAGFFASMSFWLMLIGELLGSWFSDRIMRRAPICFVGMVGSAVFLYLVAHAGTPVTAAVLLGFGMFFLGVTIPTSFALLLGFLKDRVAATGYGVCNGIGNIVGALAPFLMGIIISYTGAFTDGFLFLVVAALVGALSMLPLITRY